MRTIEEKIIGTLNGCNGEGLKNFLAVIAWKWMEKQKTITYGIVCCFGTIRKIIIVFLHAGTIQKLQKAGLMHFYAVFSMQVLRKKIGVGF